MPSYDASSAQCHIFTFKEGMLSALAHDLKLAVTQWTIDFDPTARTIDARLQADSLRVVTVMKKGIEARDELGPDHFKKIEKAIAQDVLHPSKFPTIHFVSSDVRDQDGGLAIDGTLELHGTKRPVKAAARLEGTMWVTEVELHQPDFGIKPYTAMMGTLKVKPTVRVVVSVPAT